MNYKINNILIHSNSWSVEDSVIKAGIEIANRHHANLHLLQSFEKASFIGFNTTIEIMNTPEFQLASRKLSEVAEAVQKSIKGAVSNYAEVGSQQTSINNHTINENIDLVILPVDTSESMRAMVDSTTIIDTIEKSICPVLTIPLDCIDFNFDTILYPLRNVIGVVEKFAYVEPIINANSSSLHLFGIFRKYKWKKRIMTKLSRLKQILNRKGQIAAYEIVKTYYPAGLTVDKANSGEFKLVAINATFDSKWYNPFSINFTEQMVNFCKIPVLYIRKRKTILTKTVESNDPPEYSPTYLIPQKNLL